MVEILPYLALLQILVTGNAAMKLCAQYAPSVYCAALYGLPPLGEPTANLLYAVLKRLHYVIFA